MGNVHIHINTGGGSGSASSPAQKKPASPKTASGNAAPARAKAAGLGAATRPGQQAQPAYPQSQMSQMSQMAQLPTQAPIVPTPTKASTPSGVANKKNTNAPASSPQGQAKGAGSSLSSSAKKTSASSTSTHKTKSSSPAKKTGSPSSSTPSPSSSRGSKSTSKAKTPQAQQQQQQAKTLGMQQQPGITPAGPPQAGSLLGGNGGNFMPGAGQLPPTAASPQPTQGAQNMKPPVAKSPGKEPKAPPDVETARDQQDTVLRQRQAREVQGRLRGGPRDVDAGSGFWPPMTPVL